MGAGRKTETHRLKEKSHYASSVNCSITARNLKKSELGAVIFGCKHSTINECFQMQLFGLPASHISYVKNIRPGLPLFLFNYSDRKLHGVFEAASTGGLNINPNGWTEDGSDYTPFAAQVKFKTWMQCQPLSEDQFGPVIVDNYYESRLFWFELDQNQTSKLISLFSSSPSPASSSLPKCTTKQNTLVPSSRQKDGGAGDGIGLSGQSKRMAYDGRSYSSVLKNDCHSIGHLKHANTGQSSLDTHGLSGGKGSGSLDVEDNKEALEHTMDESGLNAQIESSEDFIDESGQYDEQFEFLKQQMDGLYLSDETEDNSCLPQSVPCETLSTWEGGYMETRASEDNTHGPDKSPDVHFIVDKIQQEVNKLKLEQSKQEQKITLLEKELVLSRREIKNLKQQLKTSGCILFEETNLVTESESSVEDSVLIIGGYNGSSHVSALECYSPSHDLLESLCPINFTRTFDSTVKLNGEVYVIGGLHENLWCDTVESYNLVENQWVTRPSLNRKKGGLAGISLNEKIFAIGGGDGVYCFSEVELFDLDVGRWIPTQSMLNKFEVKDSWMSLSYNHSYEVLPKTSIPTLKGTPEMEYLLRTRFTPAAAEINGMIYVVGGFDGDVYLKSVERFDPRENSCSRLESMSTKRGCHSLAVLNEKLYAIGGYNGARMISTVEVFDPRVGSWVMGESMNTSRGCFAAVVIGNSIFVIGGTNENDGVLDMVERYNETHGWQTTNLKAIGKRCYFSVVPLSG